MRSDLVKCDWCGSMWVSTWISTWNVKEYPDLAKRSVSLILCEKCTAAHDAPGRDWRPRSYSAPVELLDRDEVMAQRRGGRYDNVRFPEF